MSQPFQHLATEATYQANLYPQSSPQQAAGSPVLGVCLSGGGSRALTCALGQLSALSAMLDSKGQTVLSQTPYLSSVSGGSWASVLYTFLPETINNQTVTDADFLIQPVAPPALVKGDPGTNSPGNVSYMGPFCLGSVPQQFNPTNIVSFLYTLYNWGFFGDSSRWSWFWIAGVGEIVLKRFGLYSPFYNPNVNYIQPSSFFSLSAEYVAANITPCNPSLDAQQFYFCRPNRPSLIVNANLLQDYRATVPAQIPMQAKADATYIPGQSPDEKLKCGGGVESFAFTSTLSGPGTCPPQPANDATVTFDRRYSLCDIAGCSSAFFAAYILHYLNHEINNLITELKRFLISEFHLSPLLAGIIADAVKQVAKPFLDAETGKLIPLYNYWPLNQVDQQAPENATYGFSDGGDFENTGILGMLAQTNVNNIISFVNTETALSKNSDGTVIVDYTVARLFGYQDQLKDGKWNSYGGMTPSEPLSYVQVFSDACGEFNALLNGLYDASCAGSTLGTAPAAFLQTLTTVDNPVANIAGGRQVTVLWVYNNRVNNWQDAITDQNLRNDLSTGQAAQPYGPLVNFPNYDTGLQIFLDQEAVNMLAQLSAWNVQQLQPQILSLL